MISNKFKIFLGAVLILLTGNFIGFIQGVQSGRAYNDLTGPSSQHIIVNSCKDKFSIPYQWPIFSTPQDKNTPKTLRPLPRIETKL